MPTFLLRRLVQGVLVVIAASLVTFIIFFALPSADPAVLRAGRGTSPVLLAHIRHNLGLDKSLPMQYWLFLKNLVLHFDLGYSYQNNIAVRGELFSRLPATISLTLGAAVLWLVTGVGIGIISAIRPGSLVDRLSMGGALVAISAPVYWLGLLALYLLATDIGKLHVLPGAGSYVPLTQNPWQWFTSLLLPWMVLATAFAALYARLMRSSMSEVLRADYIRTARAKGLSERRVILRHGLRSAITPIVTAAGIDIGTLLGGAVLVESVFNVPGVGRMVYSAIQNSDLPVIQGVVVFGTFAIVVANIIVDVLYALLDPRVRVS